MHVSYGTPVTSLAFRYVIASNRDSKKAFRCTANCKRVPGHARARAAQSIDYVRVVAWGNVDRLTNGRAHWRLESSNSISRRETFDTLEECRVARSERARNSLARALALPFNGGCLRRARAVTLSSKIKPVPAQGERNGPEGPPGPFGRGVKMQIHSRKSISPAITAVVTAKCRRKGARRHTASRGLLVSRKRGAT